MNLDDLRASTAATVTLIDTARLLGVDVRTVTRACEDGQLPCIRVGRRVLVVREKLLAMLTAPLVDNSRYGGQVEPMPVIFPPMGHQA